MKIIFPLIFIKVLVNILMVFIFISIFYFTYAAYIEKETVINQMNFLAVDIIESVQLLGPDFYNKFTNNINNLNIPNMSKEDNDVAVANSQLIRKVIIANIIFFIIMSIIIYIINQKFNNNIFSMHNVIIENIIILIFVALTEYSVLTFFGSKFISIDPYKIKYAILKNLKDKGYLN